MKEVFIPATVLICSGLLGVRRIMQEAGLEVPEGQLVLITLNAEGREQWMWDMMKLNGFSEVTVAEERFERLGRLYTFT